MGCTDHSAGAQPATPDPIQASISVRTSLRISVEDDGALVVLNCAAYVEEARLPTMIAVALEPEHAIDLALRTAAACMRLRRLEKGPPS
ncbi:MAG: hypothetical protein ACREJ5_12190 [Geminicoccaceae bacterium]